MMRQFSWQRNEENMSLASLSPVQYRSISEQVAVAIRQAIANGELKPGSRLLELEISEKMGTSRATVREALFRLEREGLVVRKANYGTFVTEVTEDLVREVASLRGLLEGYALRSIAQRVTQQNLNELELIIHQMSSAADEGNYTKLMELDYRFHEYIVREARHGLLYETWSRMDQKTRVFLSATCLMYQDMKDIVNLHYPILEALRMHNPELASAAIESHLSDVLDIFIKRVLPRQENASTSAG